MRQGTNPSVGQRKGTWIFQRGVSENNDAGTDGDLFVELDDFLIQHADTSGRDGTADGTGIIGAMNTVQSVPIALVEIESAGAQRIVGPSSHDLGKAPFVESPLPFDHFLWRTPFGPYGLAFDRCHAGPLETFATDADSIALGLSPRQDVVKGALTRDDDNGSGLFWARIRDDLLAGVFCLWLDGTDRLRARFRVEVEPSPADGAGAGDRWQGHTGKGGEYEPSPTVVHCERGLRFFQDAHGNSFSRKYVIDVHRFLCGIGLTAGGIWGMPCKAARITDS